MDLHIFFFEMRMVFTVFSKVSATRSFCKRMLFTEMKAVETYTQCSWVVERRKCGNVDYDRKSYVLSREETEKAGEINNHLANRSHRYAF